MGVIRVLGARQNNLKNLNLEIPLGEVVVVTGVSGSGKSSLVFDTLYAEGQRRYVETFSPYARQFLDRMDKPRVDRIEGIPPAIAIDQTNPVRTSRSTVGTMTELADHLKLLFARAGQLYCRQCGRAVRRDTPASILADLTERARLANDPRLVIAFPVAVPHNFSVDEVLQLLEQQGYSRIHARTERTLEVIQDRFRFSGATPERVVEALEAALRVGRGRVAIHPSDPNGSAQPPWRYSDDLHCAECDIHYQDPTPGTFSFNSPIGACQTCRGFGRVIGIDFGLVVPDESRTLAGGAIRPWQTDAYRECQDELMQYARDRGIATDRPWRELSAKERHWVLEGEPEWRSWRASWPGTWYGVRRFFDWLETKSYKMHIRVLLSRYRAYNPCPECAGSRLKPEALLWRVGTRELADRICPADGRSAPGGRERDPAHGGTRPGLSIHDVVLLPIERCRRFFDELALPAPLDQATDLVLDEIRARLAYLCEVGLGYLTLDRQSRTLSGGEVQRINLTTALGTSLVNTLFALDEPSIGLHPRDMERVIGVMRRLRALGNSLLVVEHDPQVMFAADRILDMGPGPGARGGEAVFFGTPRQLMAARGSVTASYLNGEKRVDSEIRRRAVAEDTPCLELIGARAHNLKWIDVRIPLNRLVCVTGVSGSGKSTLVEDVLYAALLKEKGRPTETPGVHGQLRGAERVAGAVMVDQSPIGKTSRSNPASYVGAFDGIRRLFAETPAAKERGYTAGTFSFNAGKGRCPSCGGNGFEHVEMQFLSDVYLRCADCDGKRFRPEILEVRWNERSIADVLDMTVSEAARFFGGEPQVVDRLRPLIEVGLDYLRLGQPVPTLSGGESQRLKLAGHIAECPEPRARPSRGATALNGRTMFLFDEPTTGLHFDDIAKLLQAFSRLLDAGHSLVVIEHNLDVIAAADWVIDLGPEGGEGGGRIVCAGTPETVMDHAGSHTGVAMREHRRRVAESGRSAREAAATGARSFPEEPGSGRAHEAIRVVHAREHNLKNIEVTIPRDRFTVITGVSGSGKSTLAFDVVFAEGQRRYLESLNAYARQFVQPSTRPDVDAIFGIPPTVAIEQRTSRGGRKSTVATLTEIHHFLRLLYVKLGVQHCPDCQAAIEPQSPDSIAARILRRHAGRRIGLLAPLVVNRKGVYTELSKWAAGKGFTHLRADGAFLPTARWPRLERFREHTLELPVADLTVGAAAEAELRAALSRALEFGKGTVHVLAPLDALACAIDAGDLTGAGARMDTTVFSTRRACPACQRSFPEPDPRMFSYNSKHGWCPDCFGTGQRLAGFDAQQTGEEIWWNQWYEGTEEPCPSCHGTRLNEIARAVRFHGVSIAELAALPVTGVTEFLAKLALDAREREIARDILGEIANRLAFLAEVGLGYLTLDRAAPTLSGGEAQRIRLAAQLGSNLQGVCYVLDEPTIGLHARDNRMLLNTLGRLRAKGNTLVVVEHDEETILRADHVVDLGPGAGANGGRVVATGATDDLTRHPDSVTGRFLATPLRHPLAARRAVSDDTPVLRIVGARLNNLANLECRLPLGRLVAITGVSGSGKSTLARDVLRDNLRRLTSEAPHSRPAVNNTVLTGCDAILGWEQIGRVLEVDQTPIGKTPRSCPATYVGFWDGIRQLFAGTQEARLRGYPASRFSFNMSGGRCPACEGQGLRKIEMSFLPDVKVICDVCRGSRFEPETLAVRWQGRNVGELLAMSVEEALPIFSAHPSIHHALQRMADVGLGYLRLGQHSPTLSGGEAQRIKLVTELTKVRSDRAAGPNQAGRVGGQGHTLYVLDEPTVGLHVADIERLIRVLHRLVDAGNSVIVVEHNLDIIAEADWIIDLGPEGGDDGGRIVAQGSPEAVARGRGHTAEVLAAFLAERARPE